MIVREGSADQNTITLIGHDHPIFGVAFSPDGNRIASGEGEPGLPADRRLPFSVKVWDAASGQARLTLLGHQGSIFSVAFSPDGNRIVSGSSDMTLKVWDAATGQDLLTLVGHSEPVHSVAFSPDGDRIVSSSGMSFGERDMFTCGSLRVWDARTGRVLLNLPASNRVSSAAFSPDGKTLVSLGNSDFSPSEVTVWDASTGSKLLAFNTDEIVHNVSYSPDGKFLVCGGKVWDANTGKKILTLDALFGWTSEMAISGDGKLIAGSNRLVNSEGGPLDSDLKVWDAATGREILRLKGHTNFVFCLAFSPDGKRLASGCADTTIKVWNLERKS